MSDADGRKPPELGEAPRFTFVELGPDAVARISRWDEPFRSEA